MSYMDLLHFDGQTRPVAPDDVRISMLAFEQEAAKNGKNEWRVI